jgi:hypothetical protein
MTDVSSETRHDCARREHSSDGNLFSQRLIQDARPVSRAVIRFIGLDDMDALYLFLERSVYDLICKNDHKFYN